ncbi:MAG TPA: DEAD/DEAH box helicase [Tepidisphaeraceae bacterium]
MPLTLALSPHGHWFLEDATDPDATTAPAAPLSDAAGKRLRAAFAQRPAAGFLHLATAELDAALPPDFTFARQLARDYLTRLCHTPGVAADAPPQPVPPPADPDLAALVLQAPPFKGLEYLTQEVLADTWDALDQLVRAQIRDFPGGAQAYLRAKNPLWRLVGRVTFHLAENKRDDQHPFAFLATYATGLSAQARVQHQPIARALQEYAGAKNRPALLALLSPIHAATEKSALAKELVDSGDLYRALAWTPRQAHRFLQDLPLFEDAGIIVRVPDWWKPARPPRPQVSVRIGEHAGGATLGLDALLDFSLAVTLDGQSLTPAELDALLAADNGLVRLKGQWVEIDRDRLREALRHWREVERDARAGGIPFHQGMRLLAGAALPGDAAADLPTPTREWTGIAPGQWLEQALLQLRDPNGDDAAIPGLHATLRPYQQAGVHWLRFLTRLGLGACLADDMGLGKTIQVIALLLHLKNDSTHPKATPAPPSLLVVPASLIANWKAELARFAPSLRALVAHPSETDLDLTAPADADLDAALAGHDLAITTYGMLTRLDTLRKRKWRLAILDEAQAIKNPTARQTKAVKDLTAAGRIALTGTPVENRLGDLWSLFDFINPGLLGSAKAFSTFAKELARRQANQYGPLRALVRPYILRRLKTDKSIIADLPEKSEVSAFCALSRRQAALYEQSVRELAQTLKTVDGIQRRGIVLAFLMRLKQICNHPAQWLGDADFDPAHSGKFHRLREICEELAQRQEKTLVFTQFREITAPLADFLAGVFGRPGLVLHGQTAVAKRQQLVADFQCDDGPPFFVLSLKAGGTGLNLTAASHVIHFDRWWNPAVENQATDRAFRIGQKKNVFVHKFVCRGTVEDRIDELINGKVALARELLDDPSGGEKLLTEMSDRELLDFVALDVHRAVASA